MGSKEEAKGLEGGTSQDTHPQSHSLGYLAKDSVCWAARGVPLSSNCTSTVDVRGALEPTGDTGKEETARGVVRTAGESGLSPSDVQVTEERGGLGTSGSLLKKRTKAVRHYLSGHSATLIQP